MIETLELRLNYRFADLLFRPDEGKNVGTSVKMVELSKEDPRYKLIPTIVESVKKEHGKGFFFGWQIKRKYSDQELRAAKLFCLRLKSVFEPTGEECGTLFDEANSCKICGANRKQITPLKLRKGTVPKKDIAQTIGGELIVSEKFVNASERWNIKGMQLDPVNIEGYSQLLTKFRIDLSPSTIVGIDPFDLSVGNDGEIYKCPNGDTIGLNLISEPYITNNSFIEDFDFFASVQCIGIKRGLLRPQPLYFCSPLLREMILAEQLSGTNLIIANIE